MLPSKNRLVKRADFLLTQKSGCRYQGVLFALLVKETENSFPRFGFVVSNKISKKATVRNLAKRRLREATRNLLTKVKPRVDIVLLGKRTLLDCSFFRVQEEIKTLFEKAKILA